MSFVRQLHEVSLEHIAECGGKAARLGEAMRLGCPVPRGVVLSTDFYRRFMLQGGLHGEIASILATMQPTAMTHFQAAEWAIHEAFAVRRLPDQVADVIREAWSLMNGAVLVVRSSATNEDSPQQSFVGQHAAYLQVDSEEAAIEAVLGCWRSLFSAKALSYAHRFGVNLLNSAMAVILQETIFPTTQGALFTADPITGNPDVFVLEELEGAKRQVVRLNPYERLPGEQLHWTQLRRIGLLLDEHLLAYQAIEWAIADGKVYLLRVRPATRIPPYLPSSAASWGADAPVLELIRPQGGTARAAKPYSWYHRSRSERLNAAYYRRAHRLFSSQLGREEVYLYGYLYARRRGPTQQSLTDQPRGLRRLMQTALSLYAARTLDQEYQELREQKHVLLERLSAQELTELSNPALAQYLREVMALHEEFIVALGRLGNSHKTIPDILLELHQRWVGSTADFWTLLSNYDDQVSVRDAALCELAQSEYATEAEKEQAFQRFFRRYRHLYLRGRPLADGQDLCCIQEDEHAARASFRAFLQDQGATFCERRTRLDQTCSQMEERVLGHLRGLRRLIYRQVLSLARRYVPLRIDREEPVLLCWVLERDAIREVGQRMRAEGLVSAADDASLLDCSEILDWLEGTLRHDYALRILLERKDLRRHWWRYAPPDVLGQPSETVHDDSLVGKAAPADVFGGLPISPGRAEGRARLVNTLSEAVNVLPGEILVCREPLFELSPLFSMVSAVVAETGGLLEHAAVLTREYDVPAVFGVEGITTAVRTGEELIVNAYEGLIVRKRVEPEWNIL